MIDNLIIEKAIEEIEVKNLGVTQQFLEIHNIAYVNDKPQITRVDRDNKDEAIVYFNVEGEMFYFTVYVDLKPTVSVRWTGTEPHHSVKFIANSDKHSMEELSALTNLTPSKGVNKGDRKNPANDKVLYKESYILIEPNREADDFDDKLMQLLNYLEQDKKGIEKLIRNANCYISVGSTFHNGNTMLGGFHINAEQIKRMGELNLAIDFDIYADGNFFK